VLPEVAAVQSLSRTGHIRFPLLGLEKQHSIALSGRPQFRDFLPAALLPSVCYATKLADNRKKLQIKNPQKTPLKIVSLIDISRAREENCCVLLGAKLSGLSFIPHLACPRSQLSRTSGRLVD